MKDIIEKIYSLYQESEKVSTDTRIIAEGSVFFALKGANFNGNEYAFAAREKGAIAAVIDEDQYRIDGYTILVDDVLTSLQQLATHHRKQLSVPVIAITGSNGKTTTKELVNAVLSTKFKTFATHGNLNNHIGVPLSLLAIDKQCEIAIIEMGANHQKEIAALCAIALPDFGLITNIGKAHLEGFGGIEGVIKGKGEMYSHLKNFNGKVFLHNDDPTLVNMIGNYDQIIKYGSSEDCLITGKLLPMNEQNTLAFEWQSLSDSQTHPVTTNLTGTYNLPNLLAAICIGHHFGVPAAGINESLQSFQPDNNRSQIVKGKTNTLIVDCYNANPTSMAFAIQSFQKLNAANRVYILGDMMELGEDSEMEHKQVLKLMESNTSDKIYYVGKFFSDAGSGINGKYFTTSAELQKYLVKHPIFNSAVLLKGSRKIKLEELIQPLKSN